MPETIQQRPASPGDAGAPSPAATGVPTEEEPLRLWERASFTAAHAVTTALLRLLSLRGLYGFGRALGTIEWLVNYRRRRRFAEALQRVIGRVPDPRERRREAREFFIPSGSTLRPAL